MVRVSIIMGSESDRELGEEAKAVLDDFAVDNEVLVYSAHKTPEALREYLKSSKAYVYIAIAGLSAALPGFIAAHTIKPVIGVPRDVKLGGLDSLLSIVQMPSGVPVSCIGIDNAKNAALLAVEILAVSDDELRKKLVEYRAQWATRTSSRRS